jgi:hypothetical protein
MLQVHQEKVVVVEVEVLETEEMEDLGVLIGMFAFWKNILQSLIKCNIYYMMKLVDLK